MGEHILVDDPRDERLRVYTQLTDPDLRRLRERESGVFIAEGVLAIRELLRSRYPVRSVLVTAGKLQDLAGDLEHVDAPVYVASQAVVNEVAGYNLHRGAVAAAGRLDPRPVEAVLRDARRVVVLEEINDQENMGVIFRNARGLGADAVLLSPTCCDPLYRRTVRVSIGHVLHVPFAVLQPWPEGLGRLREEGFRVLAFTPAAEAAPLEAVRDTAGADGRLALLFGAEGPGLTREALVAADERIRIPMAAGVDSLNIGTTVGIALWATAAVRS